KTQKQLWSTALGPRFNYGQWGDGPRGTPTVDGDFLYCVGGHGDVVCAERATGKKQWGVSLTRDLGGEAPKWGYTESPLVDGDRLVVSPGGARGGVAALRKLDGTVEWRCKQLTDPAAFSSAIVADIQGVRQYVQLTMKGVAGISAKDGKLLWYHPKKE